MNYYGGASIVSSGEINSMILIKKSLGGKKNVTIFDVGANLGEYSLLSNSIFGEDSIIYSFEPSKSTIGFLKENIKIFKNIKPINIGLGSQNIESELYTYGKGSKTASIFLPNSGNFNKSSKYTEVISIRTLDDFCKQNKICEIDLLKIDVEGYEYSVLMGAETMINSLSIKFIQFEFGKCHIDAKVFFRDFYELLSPKFNLYRILPDGLYPIKSYTSSLEIFHTSNFLAKLKDNI